jgi:uncharacterized protein YPO0396
MELIDRIEALRRRLDEAQAAAETIADGDPTALAELDAEVDAMAEELAALKGLTSGPAAPPR